MIEKKFIELKKAELEIKEYIRREIGKGKVSGIKIERTPIGERIIISTTKPGMVIGRGGEVIQQLTETLKKQFKLENPKLEIAEVKDPEFDAQTIADQIALALEKFGPMTFKMRAYRALEAVKHAGALGAEIILGGKLPGEKARSWRFHFGYLKKTGEIDIVNKGDARAETIPGTVGVKVAVVPKDAKVPDKIEIKSMEIKEEVRELLPEELGKIEEPKGEIGKTDEKPKKARKKKENNLESQTLKKPRKPRKKKEKTEEKQEEAQKEQ